MAELSPELRAALDVAKQRIPVDNHFTYGMNKGLKGHAQGLWSGMALGGGTGLLAGGLIGLTTLIAGVALPLSIPALMLGTMAMGTVTGGTVGSRIGSATGSVSGVLGEFERRMKGDKLEQEVLASPEKQQEIIEAYRRDPVVEKDNTMGEALGTSRDRASSAWRKLCDPKTLLYTVGMCSLVGMAIFAGGFLLGGGALLGALGIKIGAATLGSAPAVGAGVGVTMGVSFGITYPMLFAGMTKGTASLLSQKTARGESAFPPIKTVAQIEQEAVIVRQASVGIPPVIANENQPRRQVQQAVALDRVTQAAPSLSV